MKILLACEESQIVTQAFRKVGHEAISCDVLPTSGENPEWHIQARLEDVIGTGEEWDMIIGFPPCTHLAVSGAHRFKEKRADGRQQQAKDFFMMIANIDCPKIAIENPVGIMSTQWRKPSQIIQPWQFGEDASKATCLWLKGLPKLIATRFVAPRIVNGKNRWANQTDSGQNKLGPSEDRAKRRSATYQGIAAAMADQWG